MESIETPFRSLSSDNFLSEGASGCVYAISNKVVFKCPTQVETSISGQEEMKRNIESLENEKQVYKVLGARPHRNIAYNILSVPEGLFLQRFEQNLTQRLQAAPADPDLQDKWVSQLVSAAVWLEELGYVHGDLRPENILLDHQENIKIIDFDCSVKIGEELRATSLPFCKLDKNREPPRAGPESEQFSLGSCIYNIRFGSKPYSGLDSPVWYERHIKHEYPTTFGDAYGDIIQKCWYNGYPSIRALEVDVLALLNSRLELSTQTDIGYLESLLLHAECQEYVSRERLLETKLFSSRLQYWYRWIVYKLLSYW